MTGIPTPLAPQRTQYSGVRLLRSGGGDAEEGRTGITHWLTVLTVLGEGIRKRRIWTLGIKNKHGLSIIIRGEFDPRAHQGRIP